MDATLTTHPHGTVEIVAVGAPEIHRFHYDPASVIMMHVGDRSVPVLRDHDTCVRQFIIPETVAISIVGVVPEDHLSYRRLTAGGPHAPQPGNSVPCFRGKGRNQIHARLIMRGQDRSTAVQRKSAITDPDRVSPVKGFGQGDRRSGNPIPIGSVPRGFFHHRDWSGTGVLAKRRNRFTTKKYDSGDEYRMFPHHESSITSGESVPLRGEKASLS